MHLYQIAEPTTKKEMIMGIDLGTTNSLVSLATPDGVKLIPVDQKDSVILPSVVFTNNNTVIVGSKALNYSESHYSSKRLISHSSDNSMNYQEGIENLSLILLELKKIASNYAQESVERAVITVPAHFNEHERSAVRKAAMMAEIDLLRLLNEPTAAGISYGMEYKEQKTFLIYDMGGGTFDVSILKTNGGFFKVIATGGDNHLGGDDLDLILAEYLFGKNQVTKSEKIFAKNVKEYLSSSFDKIWYQNESSMILKNNSISLKKAESLWRSTIEKTIKIVKETLQSADLSIQQIDNIILVGGSSRLPMIKDLLKKELQKNDENILCHINPEEVVALGAGIQARKLLGYGEHTLIDIVPMSLAIETINENVEIIIPKNAPVPAIVGKMFTTSIDGQTNFKINILQGEGEKVSNFISVGIFELRGIKPMASGQARLEITFTVDANCMLHVRAYEHVSQKEIEIDVNIQSSLM